jgi:NAD(P)-dependent dehydrogenase (short-subunit alcohol dehydrogenase family)
MTQPLQWVQCDVRDSSAVDDMVRGAADTLGGLDVLLHGAGLWQPGIPGQITGDDIDFLVDTNLKATIFTNQAAYAVMQGRWRPDHQFRLRRGRDGQPDLGCLRGNQGRGVCVDTIHRPCAGGREGVGDRAGAGCPDSRC